MPGRESPFETRRSEPVSGEAALPPERGEAGDGVQMERGVKKAAALEKKMNTFEWLSDDVFALGRVSCRGAGIAGRQPAGAGAVCRGVRLSSAPLGFNRFIDAC